MGFAASLIATYQRELAKQEERKLRKPSEYVGEIKERREFNLEILLIRSFEGDYGLVEFFLMKDADENLFTWFASGSRKADVVDGKIVEMEQGHIYKLVGTIKRHEEYKGNKQTNLTRCKVLEVLQ